MHHLAIAVPAARRLRLPVTRDQIMMLMGAINLIFLGIDTYLAHSISGTIRPYEWIPIVYGPVGGALLLLAGVVALRRRPLAAAIATAVLLASVVVGLLGAYFHLVRAALPTGPVGQQVTVNLLVWAPPILGPLTFALVGLLGLSAVWVEDPPDSGRLIVPGGRRLHLPYSKTRAYFFIVSMGSLATVISAVLDHARTRFDNPYLWIPTTVGVFATVVAAGLGAVERPHRGDVLTYVAAMLLMILTGVVGALLHVDANLVREGVIVQERFIRGAPFLAPLLFCNMGALGLIALLDPREDRE